MGEERVSEPKFECDICGQGFATFDELVKHKQEKHQEVKRRRGRPPKSVTELKEEPEEEEPEEEEPEEEEKPQVKKKKHKFLRIRV